MIKEIVNLGRVVNPLASVFTMKVDSLDVVRIDIDKNYVADIYIDSVESKEDFLEVGVFRESQGSKIFLFPGSFVIEIEKNSVKTELEFFKRGLKFVENEFLVSIFEVIKRNFEEIKEFALEVAGDVKNRKNIAVLVYFDGMPIYKYEDLLEKFKMTKISIYFEKYEVKKGKQKIWVEGNCNILGIKDKLFYPKANFYYPFSTDKKIVKFDLRDDKNLFLISKKAIEYFFAGKEYLENFNRYRILNQLVFVTASAFEIEFLKKFERMFVDEDKRDYSGLISLLDRAGYKLRENVLINFYFHTSPAQGSKEIIAYIKDVMPTYLVKIEKEYGSLRKIFEDEFKTKTLHWVGVLSSVLDCEKNKRELIDVFSKIVLNKKLDFKRILFLINQRSEKDRFYLSFYLFLIWLKGGSVREIEGNSYKERLEFVLNNFELIKSSESAKVGVCVGLILKMLSFSINDFDKKVLAFVSKKLGRDKKSLIKFVNPIFERAKLHQKSDKVDINIECASEIIANMKEFDKDEFIFGLFLGDEIYNYLKGESDE
jgi:hypothetical protein